jgi:hypothetical protein
MDRSWFNAAKHLEFRDPSPFLIRLRELEPKVARSCLSPSVRSLRTNSLKEWRQMREAAIFCVGMSARIGRTVYLAKSESHDYDFIASWVADNTQYLAPVQLKEVVPREVSASSSIQATIDSLPRKYVDSKDLTVAIYLNRVTRFEPTTIRIPAMNVAALWVFGAISPDKSQWGLWGDFLDKPGGTQFVCQA